MFMSWEEMVELRERIRSGTLGEAHRLIREASTSEKLQNFQSVHMTWRTRNCCTGAAPKFTGDDSG